MGCNNVYRFIVKLGTLRSRQLNVYQRLSMEGGARFRKPPRRWIAPGCALGNFYPFFV